MDKFYVYCVFSSESEEVLYVGKGSGNRIQVSLERIRSRYPKIVLEAKKLFINLTEEEALKKETLLISEIQPKENKISSWVREKEHDRFGKCRVYFKDPEVLEFLVGLRKRTRVVVGGFEILLHPIVVGETFNLVCRKLEEGSSRSKFYVSNYEGNIYCSGSATGVVEPSVKKYDTEATLYSVVKNLAQSCFNILRTLAGLDSRILSDEEVYWKHISLKGSTVSITEEVKEEILKFFTSVCGPALDTRFGM